MGTQQNETAATRPHAMVGRPVLSVAAVLVLAFAAVVFVLRPLSIAMPAAGLDASWIAVLGQAATLPARWGVDLTFTYGPASALVTRFYTDAYLVTVLPILLAVGVAYGICVTRLIVLAVAGRRSAALLSVLAVTAMCTGLAADLAQDQDSFYFAFALTVFLLDLARCPEDRLSRSAVLAGAAVLGILALSKTSYGVVALCLCGVADVRTAVILRRLPRLTPLFLVGALATFLAFGQRLGDIGAYLHLQGEVAAGYGEAMYLPGSRVELLTFAGGAAVLLFAVAIVGVSGPPDRTRRAFAVLGTAFVLAIAFKAGFVRADTHPQIAWSLLGLAGLAVAAGLVLSRSVLGAGALGAASLAVLWIVAPQFLLSDIEQGPMPVRLADLFGEMRADLDTETQAWARFLGGTSSFAAEAARAKIAAWAAIRAKQTLPALPGSVDILPSAQSVILANGLDYHPRPSFQDYTTYTAALIAANNAFYAGADAPDWVLFDAGGLDDRYPTMTEGPLWPQLLRRYEPVERVGSWLALHRRTVPLPADLGPVLHVEARLGERLIVPETGPVFATVTVRKTLLGRLAALVFRPPALSLHVTTVDGAQHGYRFIPALGEGGFLLSPLVTDSDGFARLGVGADDPAGDAVKDVLVDGSTAAGLFYDPVVSFDLQPLTVTALPPSPEARALFDELARGRPWRRLVAKLGSAQHLVGDHLAAQPPTVLTIPVGGAPRVRLMFGVEDSAWSEGHTEGVCFAVRAARGSAIPLWRRCLDPRAVVADRGPQSAEVDLPAGLDAITAETTCPKSCDWGWSYWSGISPGE